MSATPPAASARGQRTTAGDDYAELKRLIKENGLLEKQPGYYLRLSLVIITLLAASLAALATIDNFWLLLADAALLAFVFTQIGFLGHDIGHRQVFRTARRHHTAGLAISLLLGVSQGWWIEKHNRHHTSPNDVAADPDATIPVFAFSEEQARAKRGVLRAVVKYQAYLFVPFIALEGLGLRVAGLHYLAQRGLKSRWPELLLIGGHFVLYLGLLFLWLDVWQAIIFATVHHALFGLYSGSTFAPNHKGMLLLDKDTKMDFLRQQVLTSRNVRSSPLTDFWYGGLNYQIEHHLFPTIPRNRLKGAQRIIEAFCRDRAIPYYSTGVLQSYREVFRFLDEISRLLRTPELRGPRPALASAGNDGGPVE